MTIYEARRLAVSLLGSNFRLETRNGIRCVCALNGHRLGEGPSWQAAIRLAAKTVDRVKTQEPYRKPPDVSRIIERHEEWSRLYGNG